ncbi:MAG: cell envelope biosis protein OmpA [Gemmatimonadetes bacterium]|nr:cell envelope biosis protein OmpA [Gemmatimonadota bacterium]
MLRLHSLRMLALLALAGGCATGRAPGALSPIGARVTNEVLSDDALTFDAWAGRVAAVQRSRGAGAADADADRHAYAVARAGAWLAYARESYQWDPRDATADRALDETRRIVLALEGDSVPELGALPLASDARARPDLWTALDRARAASVTRDAPVALAGAEVALVRASRIAGGSDAMRVRPLSDFERACELLQQVATAERLIAGMHAPAQPVAAVPSMAPVVELAGRPLPGEPLPGQPLPALSLPALSLPAPSLVAVVPVAPPGMVVPVAPWTSVPPARRAVQRVVHFALSSSELAMPSRTTLGEVIAMLRSHPGASVVIEGFTDRRGTERQNRELALRRAFAVRRYLEKTSVDLGRVSVAAPATEPSARRSASKREYARDRRVTLTFTGPDGEPLTLAAYQALDLDPERDLQIEQDRRRRIRAARPTTSGAPRPATTPR